MGHTRFSDRKVVVALALLCCLLWGSSYPAIKTGNAWFGIARTTRAFAPASFASVDVSTPAKIEIRR